MKGSKEEGGGGLHLRPLVAATVNCLYRRSFFEMDEARDRKNKDRLEHPSCDATILCRGLEKSIAATSSSPFLCPFLTRACRHQGLCGIHRLVKSVSGTGRTHGSMQDDSRNGASRAVLTEICRAWPGRIGLLHQKRLVA